MCFNSLPHFGKFTPDLHPCLLCSCFSLGSSDDLLSDDLLSDDFLSDDFLSDDLLSDVFLSDDLLFDFAPPFFSNSFITALAFFCLFLTSSSFFFNIFHSDKT
jgi:hypothetical protein